MKKKRNKQGIRISTIIEIGVLLVAIVIIVFAVTNLSSIQQSYEDARNEYKDVAERFLIPTISPQQTLSNTQILDSSDTPEQHISPFPTESNAQNTPTEPAKKKKNKNEQNINDTSKDSQNEKVTDTPKQESPISTNQEKKPQTNVVGIDWNGLRSANADIAGWLQVDALPIINYPVCRGADDTYYLTHTFLRSVYPAGSIFMDSANAMDFSDAATFLYGHRMDDHSMFGDLHLLLEQGRVDTSPFFRIMTPEGTKTYRIFSVFEVSAQSNIFTEHRTNDKNFVTWAKQLKEVSVVKTNVEIQEEDHIVLLATCTTDRVRRCVVCGVEIGTT